MSDKDIKALAPGTVVHGPERDYTIIKVLGKGGFGITYLVTSRVTIGNITVDVKFALKEHFISSLCDRDGDSQSVSSSTPVSDQVAMSKKSFLREAQRLHELGLSHDNIVKVNEVFSANNTAYYVMEFIEGNTLKEYIAANGPLGAAETITLMGPVIEAVGMLHRNQVAHYDIKPQNVMLAIDPKTNALRPVLIDFGLSKHYNEDGNATSTLGSHGYSTGYAPVEQYGGFKKFSPESDVYSLGATLYFCLTGKTPASAFEIDLDELRRELLPIAGQHLTSVILRAMEMKASKRTPDASTLLLHLNSSTFDNNDAAPEAVQAEPMTDGHEKGTEDTKLVNTTDDTIVNTGTPVFIPSPAAGSKQPTPPTTTSDTKSSQKSRKGLVIGFFILAAIIATVAITVNSGSKSSPETAYGYTDDSILWTEDDSISPYEWVDSAVTTATETNYIPFYLDVDYVSEPSELCDYIYNAAIPALNDCYSSEYFETLYNEIMQFVIRVMDNYPDLENDNDVDNALGTMVDVMISRGENLGFTAEYLGLDGI